VTPEAGRRRNIWLPDDLWAAVIEAAARETIATGRQVSAAEYIRRAVDERLERHKR
jgi:Arc/MetJ-type ribon-helix-helix transcriptional regulator